MENVWPLVVIRKTTGKDCSNGTARQRKRDNSGAGTRTLWGARIGTSVTDT